MDLAAFPCHDNTAKRALREDGFYRLSGLVDTEKWRSAVSCPSGTVNYQQMRSYINESFQQLDARLGWESVLTKYRVSAGCSFDASNATDASALHRDVQQHSNTVNIPVFTLIVYLDHADLKLIPGSHRHHRMSLVRALAARSTVLSFKPGDALLFHASLLHGGVFRTLKRRTIVQCFDIYPTRQLAAQFSPRIMQIWCPQLETETKRGVLVSKLSYTPVVAPIVQYLAYMIAAGGNGHGRIALPDNVDALSCEAWRPRLEPEAEKDGQFHRGNLYVAADAEFINDADPVTNARMRDCIYRQIYMGTALRVGLLVAILVVLLVVMVRSRSRP